MGYDTNFTGHVTIEPPLNEHEITYLRDFSETRRMNRTNGPYFVGGEGYARQGCGSDEIFDRNAPHSSQPGLWCQWEPSEDGTQISWNGTEKFYDSVEWMAYLIDSFLKPGAVVQQNLTVAKSADERFNHFTFDHTVNGIIHAKGEDKDDTWDLVVNKNKVTRIDSTDLRAIESGDDSNIIEGEVVQKSIC